ncbi:cytochrome bd-I ubiquinol oxidase subunit 2 apoprotein [Kushneria sinocarnis]|uniref:Cytochrome bd-I ubiquinol oxidase subunit 2 apoprotein n=1 Tax=Kushneria sinocarnis TaxID=595502 RepID=A0A420WUS3_9GAMM|nr:cytochrome d ubiquinol oxidase subunit II [Kushneria sinocarnis]RKQ97183.1 cytochrome bd-I ubiquinol oxidase subunit 2 apoprotein [Kushneria sinocarnis]
MGSELYPILWFLLIGLALMIYIVLDGFTLGLALLFPFIRAEHHRSIIINTAKPFWDGNQTWLVLAAAGVYGAFPLAYATILPALYLPLILMLLCLFCRGITFEFRGKAEHTRYHFDRLFQGSVLIAILAQGMMLGALIRGIPIQNGHFAGNALSWFSWFGVFVGVALMIGNALLGAAWLVMKTEGKLQAHGYRLIRPLTLLLLVAMVGVGIWTPLINSHIAERWFRLPDLLWLWPTPLLILLLTRSILKSTRQQREKWLFPQVAVMFLIGLFGLTLSLYPWIVPHSLTIWQAASHRSSQEFLLIGYLILIPVILIYTLFSYRVFRGKVREDE